MALLPYYYDIDGPLRMMERDFFGPGVYSPCLRHLGNVFQPLENLSEAVNRLALNDSKITADDEKFQVNVDVQHFAPEEIKVKVINGQVIVEGKHEEKRDQHGFISRQFVRKYALPKGCLPDTVQSKLSSDGVLTVVAPKVLPMPSTGEKIIPIVKTGPVRMKITTEGAEPGADSTQKDDSQKSVEQK